MVAVIWYFAGWSLVLVLLRYVYLKNKKPEKEYLDIFKEKALYEQLAETTEDFETLRKALLKRTMICVRNIWKINEEKSSMSQLVRLGALNDDLFNSLKRSENNLTVEVYDIQAEADFLKEGWGKEIIGEGAKLASQEKQLKQMVKMAKSEKKKQEAEKKKQEAEKNK